jgi:hydroxymethylpyrimidine/phosphomethylpyrimidine kinase
MVGLQQAQAGTGAVLAAAIAVVLAHGLANKVGRAHRADRPIA